MNLRNRFENLGLLIFYDLPDLVKCFFFLVVTLYFILVSHIKGRFVLSYNKGSVNKFFKLYVISRTEIFIQCLNVKENQSPTKFLLFYNEYLLILEPFFPLYEQMLIAS